MVRSDILSRALLSRAPAWGREQKAELSQSIPVSRKLNQMTVVL